MNEELQKQLIEILKGMRDNANPAFQELVRQYQGLYGIYFLFNILIGVILISLILWGIKLSKNRELVSDLDGAIFAIPVLCSIFLLIDIVNSCYNASTWMYPLGGVLYKLLH